MSGGITASHLDPHVLAYVIAAGITSSTSIRALNEYVKGLKANGLWTAFQSNSYTFGSTPSSGNYTLSYNGHSTTSLAYNATAATIQTALQLVPQLGAVTVTGSYNASTGSTAGFVIAMISVPNPLPISVSANTTGVSITAGLFTGCLYPFLGGTSSTCSYNLIDPTTHQITWHGSPTFSANGVQGNGSAQYGLTDQHISYNQTFLCQVGAYVNSVGSYSSNVLIGGGNGSSGQGRTFIQPSSTTGYFMDVGSASFATLSGITGGVTGLNNLTRDATKVYSYLRGIQIANTALTIALDTANIPLGILCICTSSAGAVGFYSTSTISMAFHSNALSVTGTAGVAHKQKITPVSDSSGSLNNKYFLIDTPLIKYYVWFNINGAGTDPALAGRTGIQITGATNVSGSTLATSINTAFNALPAKFISTVSSGQVSVANNVTGAVTAAADGASAPGFAYAGLTTGVTGTTQANVFYVLTQKLQQELGRDV